MLLVIPWTTERPLDRLLKHRAFYILLYIYDGLDWIRSIWFVQRTRDSDIRLSLNSRLIGVNFFEARTFVRGDVKFMVKYLKIIINQFFLVPVWTAR